MLPDFYSMILFPPSKLNLGLQIIAKRSDGFHDLQTVFYQFPLCDILEILKDDSLEAGTCQFSSSGLSIPGGENLCELAYYLLAKDYKLPGVRIVLHKIIPMGAGLGGGSSDAVYTLKLLNQKFNLNINTVKLKEYALILGSDCPLFLANSPQYAQGRGELLEEVVVDLSGMHLVVVNPRIHISTAEAFSNIQAREQYSCKEIVLSEISSWKANLKNDFEASIFPYFPELMDLKSRLYDLGATYAAMSGSGSTMFGLFENNVDTDVFPEDYFVWQCKL